MKPKSFLRIDPTTHGHQKRIYHDTSGAARENSPNAHVPGGSARVDVASGGIASAG